MTRRVMAQSTGSLHTITLTIPDPSPQGFRAWRAEIRNRVDYLRRTLPAWRELGFHGWLQGDGTVQGIITLGMLGRGEVEKGLERWDATLGPEVRHEDLRLEIWRTVRAVSLEPMGGRRYQGRRFSIHPCRPADRDTSARLIPNPAHLDWIDAMPVLVS